MAGWVGAPSHGGGGGGGSALPASAVCDPGVQSGNGLVTIVFEATAAAPAIVVTPRFSRLIARR